MNTPSYDDVVRFHGHSCPGLAIGYRMTIAALHALMEGRSEDEELVAIVENDACGVDAVQVVAGCSFGKGNLIFRDYGKSAYTFYARGSKRGVRVLGHLRGRPPAIAEDREASITWILTAPADEVVSCKDVEVNEPPRARLHGSVPCDSCGERVMETRIRAVDGRRLCIPCAQEKRS